MDSSSSDSNPQTPQGGATGAALSNLGLLQNSANMVSIEMSPSTEDILDLVSDKEGHTEMALPKQIGQLAALDQTMDDLSLGGDLETNDGEGLGEETGLEIKSEVTSEGVEAVGNRGNELENLNLASSDGAKAAMDISKYFTNGSSGEDDAGDFFDTIAPAPESDSTAVESQSTETTESKSSDAVTEKSDVDGKEADKSLEEDHATKVLRSISRCSAEMEVSLQPEPEPGEGEIKLPEDERVKRLLSESEDDPGQVEVFESFTASDKLDDESGEAVATKPVRHPSGDPAPIPDITGSPLHVHVGSYGAGSREATPAFHSPVPPVHHEESSADNLIHTFQDTNSELNMTDTDRMHDAWIPSESTRQILVTMATSAPGTYFPDKDQLTTPVLCMDEPMGDPIKDLVYRFMGEQEAVRRSVLTADTVSQDEEGLRKLIQDECFRAAIDLTGRLLTQHGQGVGQGQQQPVQNTPTTLQIWFVRIALLAKIRQYSLAESECAAFGNFDRPDLYYEYYPDLYPGRKGSMISFSLRLIHAELPSHLAKASESLDRLYYLHAVVLKVLNNLESGFSEDGSLIQLTDESRRLSKELWERREIQVLYSIVNRLLFLKDYHLTMEVLDQLLRKDPKNSCGLWSGMGRIYLQIGDVAAARTCFDTSEKTAEDNTSARCNCFINRGFLAMGMNNFTEARQHFKDAVDLEPENAVAVNNMAVCYLYMGQLSDALNALETLVRRNPKKYLQDGVLFNLSTLYELESSRAMHKKQTLLDLVSKHKGDSFNVACLKMT